MISSRQFAKGAKMRASVWLITLLVASIAWGQSGAFSMEGVFPVTQYGADGDGVTHDTAAFDAVIALITKRAGGTIYVPPGTYICGSISLPSNTRLELAPGCVLKSTPNLGATTSFINVASGASNVSIVGYGAEITMDGQYTTGEHRHGIYLRACDNVSIEGVKVSECGGDGLAMTSDAPVNVSVTDCWFYRNRRQGCSVIGGDDVVFTRCKFDSTGRGDSGGTDPQAGCDIEPLENRRCRGIRFTNCEFVNNVGSGLTANYALLDNDEEISTVVSGCAFRHNYANSIALTNVTDTHTGGGSFVIDNCVVYDSGGAGVLVYEWASSGPRVTIRNCLVRNGNVINSSDDTYRSHISIQRPSTSRSDFNIGNVLVDNCDFADTRVLTDTSTFTYTSGRGTEPVVGGAVTDDASAATGTIASITTVSGTWAGGDAIGTIKLRWQSGAFAPSNTCTFSSSATATVRTVTTARIIRRGVFGIVQAGAANVVDVDVERCHYKWAEASFNTPARLMVNGTQAKMRCNLAYAGDPRLALTASPGSIYRRTDGAAGTTLYIKGSKDDASGWVASVIIE